MGQGSKAEGGWGGSLAGMQSGIWFYSPVSFPIPSVFPNPLFSHTLFNHPFPPPKIILWVVYGWDVVVGGGGRKKIGGSTPQVMRSPLGLTVFLTPFRFICLAAPSGNCLNYSEYLNTY